MLYLIHMSAYASTSRAPFFVQEYLTKISSPFPRSLVLGPLFSPAKSLADAAIEEAATQACITLFEYEHDESK